MNGLLQEIESGARALIGTREIELVVDCSGALAGQPAYTDRLHLKQILENIVDYAVSSTEAGTITLLLSDSVQGGVRYLDASVADTGRGIGREELQALSDGTPSDGEYAGIGVSKRLTEALGGTIDIESEQGKGSVFNIMIPMKALLY